jgi:glyceraldehyde 3-phosphate dehydrogenase
MTTRVPVANGALADFTFTTEEPLTPVAINACLCAAAETHLHGVLQITEEPLVSLDIKGNTHSAVVDPTLTAVAGNSAKVLSFFDNEFGYTSRIIDWLRGYKKPGFY